MKPQTLSQMMDFYCVVEVHEDGTVTDAKDCDLYYEDILEYDDGEVNNYDKEAWEIMRGYSMALDGGRDGVMNSSELIGGALERDILANPGYYVALPVEYFWDENGELLEESEPVGWCVLKHSTI